MTNTSPGAIPPNFRRHALNGRDNEFICMGICSASAMTRPDASNNAQEQSRASLITVERAACRRLTPISSAIRCKAWVTMVMVAGSAVRISLMRTSRQARADYRGTSQRHLFEVPFQRRVAMDDLPEE